jgi:hypothetical protein
MPGSLWNEYYKGSGKKRNYFEGWYFKQVSADQAEIWSFIPGISLGGKKEDGYSFVQVIEGRSGKTWWFQYPLNAFHASADCLDIRVGESRFTAKGMELHLDNEDGNFHGELEYGPFTALPQSLLSPGVMGPFAFVPFMECRHGLVSLDHPVSGSFSANGRPVSLGSPEKPGRGYIEKDWGSSMPSSWIWTQSNNFAQAGDSFMLSIANIPWLGFSFAGFLCVGRLGGRFLREATYTGARLEHLQIDDSLVSIVIVRGKYSLELEATRSRGGLLRAPVNGSLTRRIAESVDAALKLRWTEKGKTIFEGQATGVGLELVGDPLSLFAKNPSAAYSRKFAEADRKI